ncbi:hypothetical protein DRO19_01530 [Candidatus Bathyarchaeota archaeon]|nr:MAG: hypothetical protein DRO19_01530 [Candidatus Bathyarchaeota archaeon]
MKKFKVPEDFVGKEYAGVYEVKELTAEEIISVDEELLMEQQKKGLKPIFNLKAYNIKCLAKSVTKDGKSLSEKQIAKMPAKLYQLLLKAFQELNMLTGEEERFLLSQ